jgi:hypothetical protein
MYPGRMRTTEPEATAAKQKRLVEARAAARKALTRERRRREVSWPARKGGSEEGAYCRR